MRDPSDQRTGEPESFRSLICKCFRGQYYSITLRRTAKTPTKHQPKKHRSTETGLEYEVPSKAFQTTVRAGASGYALEMKSSRSAAGPYLFQLAQCKEVISEVIFCGRGRTNIRQRGKKHVVSLGPARQSTTRQFQEQTGLVGVAGSTSSGKSQVVRGLIDDYLRELVQTRCSKDNWRRPHLVTYEDPIEEYFYDRPDAAQKRGFDYTPRQKGIDGYLVRDVLIDCLRQTPAVVYVGETRDASDWQALVDFAGRGHLVFTTCHAGSLAEVITAIRDSVVADTTSRRSVLASRLLAVVHLKSIYVESSVNQNKGKVATLPALWIRTPAAVNALTADGPSVILPHSGPASPGAGRPYCYGRTFFATQLLSGMTNDSRRHWSCGLRQKALEHDLEGL